MKVKDASKLLDEPLLLLPKQAEGEFKPYLARLFDAFLKKNAISSTPLRSAVKRPRAEHRFVESVHT
jgi:hypothetical protein